MMLWLLMVDLTSGDLTCPKYKCAKSGELSQGVCVSRTSSTVYVSQCTDSQYSFCQLSSSDNSTCVIPAKSGFAYPGEKCIQATDCKYGTCINNHCFGQEFLSSCKDSGECNPGLQCGENTLFHCLELSENAESGCSTEFDCTYDMTCDDGHCVPYYSVKNNYWISNCSEGFSDACESGQCLFGLCVEGAETHGGYPRKCLTETDCYSDKYESQGVRLYTNCSCGMNTHGQGYCDLFPGDKAYKDYIDIKKDWIKKGHLNKCNTLRRFSRECIASHYSMSYAYEFEYKMFRALYYSFVYDAEDCALKVVLPDFYKDTKEVEDSGYSALISALVTWLIF